MKKIFLSAGLALYTCAAAFGNAIHFENLTAYPLNVLVGAVDVAGVTYASPYVTINPGPTDFTDPTAVPGMPAVATSSDRFNVITGDCAPYDLMVGNPALGGNQSQQNFPAGTICNNGIAFSVIWVENPNFPYNVTVLIF